MKLPSYEKKLRERAIEHKLYLVTFDFEGRPAKIGGRATFQFTLSEAEAAELEAKVTQLFLEHGKKRKS